MKIFARLPVYEWKEVPPPKKEMIDYCPRPLPHMTQENRQLMRANSEFSAQQTYARLGVKEDDIHIPMLKKKYGPFIGEWRTKKT